MISVSDLGRVLCSLVGASLRAQLLTLYKALHDANVSRKLLNAFRSFSSHGHACSPFVGE
jgi:hypothetical protein